MFAAPIACLGYHVGKRIVHQKVRAALDSAQKKFGVPIAFDGVAVSFFGVTVENLRVGAKNTLKAGKTRITVGLFPFQPTFLEVDTVAFEGIEITLEAPDAAAASEAKLSVAATRGIDQIFGALPVPRLIVNSGRALVVDSSGSPLATAFGLKLLIDRKEQRILFRATEARIKNQPAERHLQGRLELAATAGDYRFFIRRKVSAQNRRNMWAIKGTVRKDWQAVDISASANQLPAVLGQPLTKILGARPRLGISLRATLRKVDDEWLYDGHVRSDQLFLAVPLFASQRLGPARFAALLQGTVVPNDNVVTVDAARLELFDAKATTALPVTVAATIHFGQGSGSENEPGTVLAIEGELGVPPTTCQNVLAVAPPGLLPALEGFALEGTTEANVRFRYDSMNSDATVAEFKNTRWGCRVAATPPDYAPERLRGAFAVQRQGRDDGSPMTIQIDQAAPSFTSLTRLGQAVHQAFIAAEDAGFFIHRGIDLSALQGALRRNLAEGRIAVGGSTITMQLVKNLFLTPERTLSRKLQELFLAWYLEQVLTKDRILEIYLNVIEFGPGIYGITQAAEHFFGKHPFDLSLLESAYLASLLPAPKARYRYFCAGELNPSFTSLVHAVLRRLLALGRISADRYAGAIAEGLAFDDDHRHGDAACAAMPPEALGESAAGVEP